MRRHICGVSLLLLLAASMPAPAADDAQSPAIIPGGVTDAAGKIGYLSLPKGGIVAVDLEKGDVLWESKEANRPLIVAGNRLAALATDKDKSNVLRVVAIDTDPKGKKSVTSPIKLPDWAVVGTGRDHQQAGKSFMARAQLVKGSLVLKWWAGSRYYGGAAPSPEVLKNATKDATGIATVNLETGKVEMKQDDKLERPSGSGLEPVAKLPKEVQEVARRENWQFGVVVGPRAYGQVQKAGGKVAFGAVQNVLVQAVDLKTGKLLWERVYEEQRILPPPP
jgi:outer membrane protein assembly factor BamB